MPQSVSVSSAVAKLSSVVVAYGIAQRVAYELLDSSRRVFKEDREEVVSPTGNRLSFMRKGSKSPRLTLVAEAGLFSSGLSWQVVGQNLVDALPDVEVITYDRASYGGSTRNTYQPWSFSEAIEDLGAVIGCARSESVILAGHSLGGLIVHLVTTLQEPLESVVGQVLIEPSHPRELRANPSQGAGARNIHSTMKLAPNSMRAGLGYLLSTDSILGPQVGETLRKPMLRELKTPKMWAAAAREWAFVYPTLLDATMQTRSSTLPTLVIVGEDTEASKSGQRLLYDDFLGAEHGSYMRISGADHLGLLIDDSSARMTADAIADFLTGTFLGQEDEASPEAKESASC